MSSMTRTLSLALACALVVTLPLGCTKSTTAESGAAQATGPVTDVGSTGLKSSGNEALSTTGDAVHGKAIFSQNCSACHGATGTQGGVGPSLKHEKTRKNFAQTVAWIKNPTPPMPKLFPSPLGEQDVQDAAAYVQSL
jgi:mono/diheme cytochrome c family protein